MSDHPEWIKTGTKVLCYTNGRTSNLKVTEIARVATKSFTLVDERQGRFRISAEPRRYEGGSYGWSRCVIPLDSDKARSLLHESQMAAQRASARVACDEPARFQDQLAARLLYRRQDDLGEGFRRQGFVAPVVDTEPDAGV